MGVREIAAQADFFKKSAEYLMLKASQLATADAGETFNPSAFAQNLVSLFTFYFTFKEKDLFRTT